MKYKPLKIVKTPPQTELDKPLKVSIANVMESKKRKKRKVRVKEIHSHPGITAKTQKLSTGKKKKDFKPLCSECRSNPVWLDYAVCYECYMKNINAKKKRTHWHGGTGNGIE